MLFKQFVVNIIFILGFKSPGEALEKTVKHPWKILDFEFLLLISCTNPERENEKKRVFRKLGRAPSPITSLCLIIFSKFLRGKGVGSLAFGILATGARVH